MVQPPIWFLTPEEITTARHGCSRGLNPYSLQGNSVKLLVNGDQVFDQLYRDLLSVGVGDFVWMTGWDIDGAVMLYPNPEEPKKAHDSRIDSLLLAAIGRGVQVRMLLNTTNLLDVHKPFEFADALNSAAGETVCSPDDRHNGFFGSLHQKSWVIKRNGETVAYVGSMDIAAGRFDTRKHDQNDWWKYEPPFQQGFYGFTGGMLYIRGQAVLDVARHLFDQITDPVDPFYLWIMAPTTWPNPPIGVYSEPAQLQVLLSAGPRGGVDYGYYSNWAPKGELTILAATLKAISRATRYIYLSDQFMWYPPIMEAIAARLPHVAGVLLLTDSGYALDHVVANYDITSLRFAKFYYQHSAWKSLQGSPKVSAYHMIKEGLAAPPPVENMHNIIYAHWKVLIVDDEYAIVGSAGVEQSGMTNDLDMSVGVCDPATVIGIRKQLWSEHLNISPEDPRLADPVSAIKQLWPAIADAQPPGRVRAYWPDDVEWYSYYREIFEVFEPCGLLDQSACMQAPTLADVAARGPAALSPGLRGVARSRGYLRET
jgi:phosphatidylserine/phosphatidylglycerophosphate/cardiolipin synthase-like enzyme